MLSEATDFVHGSTVAINTAIERKGAVTALIVTRGMRDLYAIGRGNRPEAYNLFFERPEPRPAPARPGSQHRREIRQSAVSRAACRSGPAVGAGTRAGAGPSQAVRVSRAGRRRHRRGRRPPGQARFPRADDVTAVEVHVPAVYRPMIDRPSGLGRTWSLVSAHYQIAARLLHPQDRFDCARSVLRDAPAFRRLKRLRARV